MPDRSVLVRLRANVHDFNRNIATSSAAVSTLESRLRSADKEGGASIDRLSGRLRVLAEVAAILGPTLAPLGGVAVAGVSGLANQLGIAAVAGGVLIGSLQGVGDALSAMNKAQLEPTEKNLEKAEAALKRLSPAARDFAKEAFALKPALVALRDIGAEALMPGLTESLDSLERLGPKVAGIMESFGSVLGDIAEDSTSSLASERWADFFEFIRAEGPSTLSALATTVGDLTHGLAELWEAFSPLNNDFSSWLMGVADGFDDWATGLSATEGFSEFVDYIQTTGPQLADTLGAIASAAVQIVQATAPLATPVMAGLEAAANAIGAIADSDLGTPIMGGVTALALLNRTLAVTASLSKVSLSSGLFAGLGAASKGIKGGAGSIRSDLAAMSDGLVAWRANADKAGEAAERMKSRLAKGAGLAGLAVAATGAADGLGLTNTMSLALMGSLAGPPGVALGAAAGALLDMKAAGEGATAAIQGLDAAIQSGDAGVLTEQIAAAKAELADITNLDFGGDIFDRIGFQIADTFGGPSMDDARANIDAAEQALADLEWQEKKAAIEAKGAALEFLTATGANVDLAKWSGKSTEQIKAQADALREAQQNADETARSFITLGEGVDDSKVSMRQWIQQMNDEADALNNFVDNAKKASKRGLRDGLINDLQDLGTAGALRMRQLSNATDEEIAKANRAWERGEKAIERYNNYKVPPKKVTADVSRALQSFREVDQYLSALDGKTATTYVNTVRTVTGLKGAAAFSQNAWGDVKDRHDPQIAPGGAWRVWAEPETQGETYIPHANDARRPRAKSILEQTATMFGGSVQWFAGGGTAGGGRRASFGGAVASPEIQELIDRFGSLGRALRQSEKALERETGQRDKAQSALDATSEAMNNLAAATTSGFRTSLFQTEPGDSNIWAPGARGSKGGLFENLSTDISGLQKRGELQSALALAGLDGAALEAALSQGNNDDLTQLLDSGRVQEFEDMFGQREALLASVGAQAGQMVHGNQYNAQADELARQTAELQGVKQELRELRQEERQREREREARADARADRQADRTGDKVNGAVTPASRNNPRPKVGRL